MTDPKLKQRFTELCAQEIPNPGSGRTVDRHRKLFDVGREDLTLAKLVEAHWDAVAILAEAGRHPLVGAKYAVWASEIPGQPIRMERNPEGWVLHGTKHFCSGAGLVDRALMTADSMLFDVDLRQNAAAIEIDGSAWSSDAFRQTATSSVHLRSMTVPFDSALNGAGWYTARPGFWHGACGPGACWAGGSAGLLDVAMASKREDPHTVAHLGAMHANIWAMQSILDTAGREIDSHPGDCVRAHIRALQLRHLIEQACTDTLRRFARAYGPHPLSMNHDAARRYQELDLYLRQSHAERDLEALGKAIRQVLES